MIGAFFYLRKVTVENGHFVLLPIDNLTLTEDVRHSGFVCCTRTQQQRSGLGRLKIL